MKNNEAHTKVPESVADDVSVDADVAAAQAESVEGAVPSEIDGLLSQVAHWKETAMRAQAEFENTKKRLMVQQQTALERAGERVVTALIPVIDDIEYGITHAQETDSDMLAGLQAIHAKMATVLAGEGVTILDPVGQPFDHDTAQAVQMVVDETRPDQTVAQVLQKGYVMGDSSSKDGGTENRRVLRPAMVVVSTHG